MQPQPFESASSLARVAVTRRGAFKAACSAALCGVVPLASCHAHSDSGGRTDARGNTTLSWSMWSGGSDEQRAWVKAAEAVHREHPRITVELQTSAFADYFTRLGTRIAGDEAPCLVSMQSLRLGTFAETMRPLDAMIAQSSINPADFDANALKALQSDGKQIALPYDNGPILILYNKDMFQKAGVREPTANWSMKDFERIAKELTHNHKFGYIARPTGQEMLSMLLSYNGARAVTQDGHLQLDSSAMVEAFTWYTSLVHGKRVAPQISGDTDDSTDQFIAGNVAMVATGPWDILSVNAQADFKVGLVRLPAGRNGSKTLSAGSGFGISGSCDIPDKAFEALQVLTGQKVLNFLAEQGRAFPARLAAQNAWHKSAPAGSKAALTSSLKTAKPMMTTSNWNDVETGIGQYGGQAFNGEESPRKVLSQLQHEFESTS